MLPVGGSVIDDGLVGFEDSGVSQIARHGDVLLLRLVVVKRRRGVELFVHGGEMVELLLLFGGDGGTEYCTREGYIPVGGRDAVCCCCCCGEDEDEEKRRERKERKEKRRNKKKKDGGISINWEEDPQDARVHKMRETSKQVNHATIGTNTKSA